MSAWFRVRGGFVGLEAEKPPHGECLLGSIPAVRGWWLSGGLLTHLVAVLARHHHVEQDEVGGDALEQLERFPAVAGHLHLEAELLHQELERQDDVRLVVGDQ